MNIRHKIRQLLWKYGWDILPFSPIIHPLARKKKLFEQFAIDTVIDVGANIGQFALEIREDIEFDGVIISFEPVKSAYEILANRAKTDDRWITHNFAIGNSNESREINIANNSLSSSILDMLSQHNISSPSSRFIDKQMVTVKRIDDIYDSICGDANSIFLKIDTQGYENEVLLGAERSITSIDTVQMELSFVPLYKDEVIFIDMYEKMSDMGYSLVSIQPGFSCPYTCKLLQADFIFHRFH